MKKVCKVALQVALKVGDATQSFTFSRTWKPRRTVVLLGTGPLALIRVTFYVSGAELNAEDLVLVLIALKHLSIDKKILLGPKRDVLDGYD